MPCDVLVDLGEGEFGGERPAWMPCVCGEEYRCTIHGGHVAECECPPIEEWSVDPYMTGGI